MWSIVSFKQVRFICKWSTSLYKLLISKIHLCWNDRYHHLFSVRVLKWTRWWDIVIPVMHLPCPCQCNHYFSMFLLWREGLGNGLLMNFVHFLYGYRPNRKIVYRLGDLKCNWIKSLSCYSRPVNSLDEGE